MFRLGQVFENYVRTDPTNDQQLYSNINIIMQDYRWIPLTDTTLLLVLRQLLSAPTTTIATTATVHTRVCALYYIHTIILLLYSFIIYIRARSYHYNRCKYTAERRIDTRPSAGFIRMWNERLLCEELLLRNEIYSFFF